MRSALRPFFSLILLGFILTGYGYQMSLQNLRPVDSCQAVRYLLDNEITPYDLGSGGGVIKSDRSNQSEFTYDYYLDTWTFNVQMPRSGSGTPLSDFISLTFEQISEGLELEYALFWGMQMLQPAEGDGYRTFSTGDRHEFPINRDGAYTLVIRRVNILDQQRGTYRFIARFNEGGPIVPNILRDETTLSPSNVQPSYMDTGLIRLPLDAAEFQLHPGAAGSLASRVGISAQVFLLPGGTTNSLLVNDWVDMVHLTGGDLAVRGATDDGPRLYYFKNYGYETNMVNGDLTSIVDSNNVEVGLNWDILTGVWIDEYCAGFKLRNGTSILTNIQLGRRSVAFNGTVEAATIRAFIPDQSGNIIQHDLTLDWHGVTPASEITLFNGVLNMELLGRRNLTLESRQINLEHLETATKNTDSYPVRVSLNDRQATIISDWVNIDALSLVGNTFTLVFNDAVRRQNTIERTANRLALLEALEDVVRIAYQGDNGLPGAEHLLLPGKESYIEILTPAGLPTFTPTALPDEPGYFPRGLNNLGGECYPINTLQAQANCPLNGHPNPANRNVWYVVTDLIAFGGLIDLSLTRSYNSMDHQVNGPFGPGWNTPFRLDFDTAFSPETNSRLISPLSAASYPVGLDLTWAPRGIVTAIMPSGSRHVFRTQATDFTSGDLQAISMPGWTLHHESYRAEHWILQQDDGLSYSFDRAGRLVEYGYPEQGRRITLAYPEGLLNGIREIGPDAPIIVTDAPEQRQLELVMDGGRIIRSILRDLTQDSTDDCSPEVNCFETSYHYNDKGYLVMVNYADGMSAIYAYDEEGRMTFHDDPRAPVAMRMTYIYDAEGGLIIRLDDENRTWRSLEAPVINTAEQTLARQVTNEHGNSQTLTYDISPTDLRSAGTTFTLQSESHPLQGTREFTELPISYVWQEGILQSVNDRIVIRESERSGRVSTQYLYADSGYHPTRIQISHPEFRAVYNTVNGLNGEPRIVPTRIVYPDGAAEQFLYDQRGRLGQMTNVYGGIFDYAWNLQNRLGSVTSQDDGTITSYAYNNLGLVRAVYHRRMTDPLDQQHTITYNYDALGRLVRLTSTSATDSPLRLDLTYSTNRTDSGTTISMIDTTGIETRSRFDMAGRIIEQRVIPADGGPDLRRVTYDYDSLGQIRQTTQYLFEAEGADIRSIPIVTEYRHASTHTLSDGTRIDGHTVTIIDPLGRPEKFTYDALERIRQIEDYKGYVYRYDYDEDGLGLRITERFSVGGQLISTTDYLFETRWQLRGVRRTVASTVGEQIQEWQINFDQFSTRLSQLVAGRWQQNWPTYNGRPGVLNLSRDSLLRDVTGINPPSPAVQATYDHLGRPTRVTYEAEDNTLPVTTITTQVRYCPLPYGAKMVIYALPNADPNQTFDCESEDFARAVTYDAEGRIQQVSDASGTRHYDYQVVPGGWRVMIDLGNGESWILHYDALGQVTQWRDEHGITRDYAYDSLGRLISLNTSLPDGTRQPEASFIYTYNAINQVTSVRDQLGQGRGTRYSYDDLGRLTVRQDIRTANATIYGYNSSGMLTTAISPLGSSTAFLYEDPADPTRLTRIIDPTGNTLDFAWDAGRNQLSFTDARGNILRHTYDRYGALWRVEELDSNGNLLRQHDLHYDAAGSPELWNQAQPRNAQLAPAVQLQIQNEPGQTTIRAGNSSTSWGRIFSLNALGQTTGISSLEAPPIQFAYSSTGQLRGITAADQRWDLAYETGRPHLRYTTNTDQVYEMDFDALNRLVTSSVDGTVTSLSYERTSIADLMIHMTTETGGQVITYATGDDATRPTALIVRTPGQRLTYLYNDEGQLTEISHATCVVSLPETAQPPVTPTPGTDAMASLPDACLQDVGSVIWRVTQRITYDPLGRPARYIDEEQNIETFTYDDAGNLSIYQNANGTTINYVYDSINRLIHLTSATGMRLLLDYDNLDHVTGICRTRAENANSYRDCATNPEGIIATYSYDPLGRLASSTLVNRDTPIVHNYDVEGGGLLTDWGLSTTTDAPGVQLERDPVLNSLNAILVDESIDPAPAYAYDNLGRITSVSVGGRVLSYDYLTSGGYTVTDSTSGIAMTYATDSSGFLSYVGLVNADSENQPAIEYRLSSDGRILVSRIPFEPDETGQPSRIEIQLNRHGETHNVAYVNQDLYIDFVLDPIGHIQRQSINGSESYFEQDADGYIIVYGYDNDDRPLTLRISDRATGRLLFLLNYTYDGSGRRITENRQFADGTQITITNNYQGARIIRRTITRTESGGGVFSQSAAGGSLGLLGGFLALGLYRPKRRHFLLHRLIILVFVPLLLSSSVAQDAYNLVQSYQYDSAGNLTEVQIERSSADPELAGSVCARYRYDSANRLRQADTYTDTARQYDYMADRRLSSIDQTQLIYHDESSSLLATFASDDAPVRFYGSALSSAPFMITDGNQTRWLMVDGRGVILGDTERPGPLWLFDPLGGFLSPSADNMDNPCLMAQLPDTLTDLEILPFLEPGTIWDIQANLYFKDGRVYAPDLGIYLQQDPSGPASYGNLYTRLGQLSTPPRQQRPPSFTAGLFRLDQALDTLHQAESLQAQAVLNQHLAIPQYLQIEPIISIMQDITEANRQEQIRQLDLPQWLSTQYNLSSAYVDPSGVLRMPQSTAPGQGEANQPFVETYVDFSASDHWLPAIAPASERFRELVSHSTPRTVGLTVYLSDAWLPNTLNSTDILYTPQTPYDLEHTPRSVMAHLPQVLVNPAAGADTFAMLQALAALPNRSGQSWVDATLNHALPQLPQLPPADRVGWLANWFTQDTLGLAELLSSRWPLEPDEQTPVPHIGRNGNWWQAQP